MNNINPNKLTFTVKHKILRISGVDYKRKTPSFDPFDISSMMEAYPVWTPRMIKFESDIIGYRKKYSLQWKVSKDTISNHVCSDIMGEMFVGMYGVNDNAIFLILCGLPSKKQVGKYVDGIQAQFILNIKECDLTYHNVATFKYGHHPHVIKDNSVSLSTFDMNDYEELNEFTFCLDIKILHEIGMNGSIIGSNIDQDWATLLSKDADTKQAKKAKSNKTRKRKEKNKANELFRDWLSKFNLERYYYILEKNGFDDFEAIITTNLDQLKAIGIDKIGHRQKLMNCIQRLKDSNPNKVTLEVTDFTNGHLESRANSSESHDSGSDINDKIIVPPKNEYLNEFKLMLPAIDTESKQIHEAFTSGKSINDIVRERRLSRTLIEKRLADMVINGYKIDWKRLPFTFKQIKIAFDALATVGIGSSYDDIRKFNQSQLGNYTDSQIDLLIARYVADNFEKPKMLKHGKKQTVDDNDKLRKEKDECVTQMTSPTSSDNLKQPDAWWSILFNFFQIFFEGS